MDYLITEEKSFLIAGIELRTTNQNGQAAKDIPQFWQKFYEENILAKIPGKIDDEVLGVYLDYEGDFMKPYTLLIGCRVESIENLPSELVGREIPECRYAVFNVKGEFPNSLLQTWRWIWDSDLQRAYEVDLEVYGERFAKGDKEMQVCVSIK